MSKAVIVGSLISPSEKVLLTCKASFAEVKIAFVYIHVACVISCVFFYFCCSCLYHLLSMHDNFYCSSIFKFSFNSSLYFTSLCLTWFSFLFPFPTPNRVLSAFVSHRSGFLDAPVCPSALSSVLVLISYELHFPVYCSQ